MPTCFTSPEEFGFLDERRTRKDRIPLSNQSQDVSNLFPFNDGMQYLLTSIDVFSKRAWAIPIRSKSARDAVEALEKIVDERNCNMVQSDKETKFLNSTF